MLLLLQHVNVWPYFAWKFDVYEKVVKTKAGILCVQVVCMCVSTLRHDTMIRFWEHHGIQTRITMLWVTWVFLLLQCFNRSSTESHFFFFACLCNLVLWMLLIMHRIFQLKHISRCLKKFLGVSYVFCRKNGKFGFRLNLDYTYFAVLHTSVSVMFIYYTYRYVWKLVNSAQWHKLLSFIFN